MNRCSPSRQPRLLALVTATAALVLSATMSVSYARPFGSSGYGGYGGYGAATVVDAR